MYEFNHRHTFRPINERQPVSLLIQQSAILARPARQPGYRASLALLCSVSVADVVMLPPAPARPGDPSLVRVAVRAGEAEGGFRHARLVQAALEGIVRDGELRAEFCRSRSLCLAGETDGAAAAPPSSNGHAAQVK
eukprot:3153004-Pyramimonas_sp.AAC.1